MTMPVSHCVPPGEGIHEELVELAYIQTNSITNLCTIMIMNPPNIPTEQLDAEKLKEEIIVLKSKNLNLN